MFLSRFKRYFIYAAVVLSFVLIFVNEYLIYSLYRLSWSSIRCQMVNCTRILLVSDPQILGETFDTNFYSGIAIYDSDQYVKKTFAQAFAYAKPDVVCFLGDLMDEGSVATDEQYKRYLHRFNAIFTTSSSVKRFYIPGDNDIGGERQEHVTTFNIKRFSNGFNETSSMLIGPNNRLRILNINLLTHVYPDINEIDATTASVGTYKILNIVATHVSLLSYPGLTMKTIMDQFKPNIIFSGHWHLSRIITYPPQNIEHLVDNRVVKIKLNHFRAAENYRTFTEIVVPASSYRMGVTNIGYGYAVVATDYTKKMRPHLFIDSDASVSYGPSSDRNLGRFEREKESDNLQFWGFESSYGMNGR